jgi:thioredoxin 1
MIAPILDELADEYAGKVRIGKVNVDEQQDLAAQYGIQSIPTLLLFQKGEVIEQVVGLRSKRELKTKFDRLAA